MSRTIDALSWPGSNCVGVVVGMIHAPARRIELAVGEAEGVAGENAGGAVIDDGLVMQRVPGRVHAFEGAAGEFESLAVLGDGDAFALDGQDFAVQLRIQLVAIHGARAGDELGGVEHVRRAARMHHAGGARQRAHERARAAGMVEVHVREEQEVHRVGRDLQLFERREDQRNGRVRAGVDDRRAAARDDDVRGIHLRPHVFRVDGGDAVGECRQSWHDCIHGLRQHSSMNRKITPDHSHGICACASSHTRPSKNAATSCSTTSRPSTRRSRRGSTTT